MPQTKPIPDGFTSITPYLAVKSANEAISFWKEAFGARELMRLSTPDGGVAHAEIQIGNSRLMVSDEMPGWGNKSAQTLGASPVAFLIYVEDVDEAFDQAVKAGATVKRPVEDQFYGDRVGTVIDPFGYQWSIGTHKVDMTTAEMQASMEKMFSNQ